MKLLTLVRASEWWEYKLPPVLAAGYMVIFYADRHIPDVAGVLIIVLLSLVNGAAYVSLLNDATDVADDAAAGKKNGMVNFSVRKRMYLVAIPVIAATGFTCYYAANKLSMALYICCYLCFTLYSLPPFRLKKRGASGILADAAGSQLFPTLFIAVFLLFKTDQPADFRQLSCIGAWSFCWGLRGILWHQFQDMQNDIVSGTHTLVRTLGKKGQSVIGTLLICTELGAFAAILILFKLLLPALVLLLYFIYVAGLHKRWKVAIILINPPAARYRIFMNEYYQVLLPFSILLSAALKQPAALAMLIFHFILFPRTTIRVLKEGYDLLAGKTRNVQAVRPTSVPVL